MKYGNDTDYTAVDLYTGIELIMVYYRDKSNRNTYPAFMRNQFYNASYSTVTEYRSFLFSNDYNPTSIDTKTLTLELYIFYFIYNFIINASLKI